MSNSLCSSDSGSPESAVTPSAGGRSGINPTQLATAPPRHVATSPAFGRDPISPSQQFWVKSHSESENPMAEAFTGFFGRSP